MSSPKITLNLTDGAGLSRDYDGLTTKETGTLIAHVSGLTDGSSGQAQTALGRAEALAQATYPPYSGIAGITTVGVVMGHRAIGYSVSDDVVRVAIRIDTPTVNYTPTFVISDTTSTTPGKTQILRNKNGNPPIIQLQIEYASPVPNGGQNGILAGFGTAFVSAGINNGLKKQYVPTVSFDETVRKIVFNAVLVSRNFAPIRAAVRTVNSTPYLGLPAGYWKFDVFHTDTKDLGRTYAIQAEISTYIDHDWSKYEVLKDRNNGQFVTCDPFTLAIAETAPYKWGYIYGGPAGAGNNGAGLGLPFIRVGPYVTRNFSNLFALPPGVNGQGIGG